MTILSQGWKNPQRFALVTSEGQWVFLNERGEKTVRKKVAGGLISVNVLI